MRNGGKGKNVNSFEFLKKRVGVLLPTHPFWYLCSPMVSFSHSVLRIFPSLFYEPLHIKFRFKCLQFPVGKVSVKYVGKHKTIITLPSKSKFNNRWHYFTILREDAYSRKLLEFVDFPPDLCVVYFILDFLPLLIFSFHILDIKMLNYNF
jgi:hypothetical protein